MKKMFVCFLTLLSSGAAFALPVGNPSSANLVCDGLFFEGSCCKDPCCDPCGSWCDMFNFRVGFWGDYVYNRHLETDSHGAHGDIEDFEIFTNAGIFSVNICDRVDLFTTLGATKMYLSSNVSTFGGPNGTQVKDELDTDFSWSVGMDGVIWECGCTSLGGEFQYFRTCPNVKSIYLGEENGMYPGHNQAIDYNEWQLGLGVSHRINMLIPYAAIKWSHVCVDISGEGTVRKFHNKKHWGYAIGFSLVDCEKGFLTVEGRWADEKAVHFTGQIRF
ncbi:MAG: hypothetical protein KDK55_05045 [Chlamydiia bacterium]|nr:hypothetical protein [Chlamydiia bacterium]